MKKRILVLLVLLILSLNIVAVVGETAEGYSFTISDEEATIRGYTGSSKSPNIPAMLDEYPVIAIADSAFYNRSDISGTLTIPSSVTSIGEKAFHRCPNIDKVYILSTSYSLGDEAFNASSSLFYGYEGTAIEEFAAIYDRTFISLSDEGSIADDGTIADKGSISGEGWLEKKYGWVYYLNGSKVEGWLQDGDHWFYMNPIGIMQTGWLTLGSDTYYLQANGARSTGSHVMNGKQYTFNFSGVLQSEEPLIYDILWSLVFFLILSAGSVLGASTLNRNYEEMLPISVFSIMIIQFLFGVLGQLKLGAYVVFVLALLTYLWSIGTVIRHKSLKGFFSRMLTPGFAITIALYLITNLGNYQKLAYLWDEFSHWADIVKTMVSLDDFGSNPLSMSAFKSYVPALPLFQYNMQVLGQILKQNYVFVEWHLYLCYQMATYSLLIYFTKDLTWKKINYVLVYGLVIFLLPTAFFSFFDTLYIDAFLAVLSGCSFAYLMAMRKNDRLDAARFILSLSCLVLTKDVGLFIAAFLALLYMSQQILNFSSKKSLASLIFHIFLTIGSIVLPKGLWNYNISQRAVQVGFSTGLQPDLKIKSLIFGDQTNYRWVTAQNYWKALSENKVRLGDTSLEISYLILVFVMLIGIVVLLSANKQAKDSIEARNLEDKWLKHLSISIIFFSAAYLLGMCAMYMFKFSQYEALRLASLSRYLSVLFLMLFTVFCVLMAQYTMSNRRFWYVALLILIMLIPTFPAKQFLSGTYVRHSVTVRAPYTAIAEDVRTIIPDTKARVYIISQEDNGFDYWVLKYSLRPFTVNDNFIWSIGKSFYEGDIWSKNIRADDWMDQLIKDYDYVLLYKSNYYFLEEFAKLFRFPDELTNNTLYVINKEERLLYPADYQSSYGFIKSNWISRN